MNEAEILFTDVLNCDRLTLHLKSREYLTGREQKAIVEAFMRRMKGEPLQYVLGKAEFLGLELKVSRDVLIPRPETEILVEVALRYAKEFMPDSLRILDLCTGSGCVGLALAKSIPNAVLDAVDICESALKVARDNALANKLNVNFIKSDLFSNLKKSRKYNIIVTNPPYVLSSEIKKLAREIRFEPRKALDGGPDGLKFYRKILRDCYPYMKTGGYLIMELGFRQKDEVINILKDIKEFELIEFLRDYNNIERIMVLRKFLR